MGRQGRGRTGLGNFPDYEWHAGTQAEKEWDTYFDLLYPDDHGLNAIMNDRVRQQLEEHGDDDDGNGETGAEERFPIRLVRSDAPEDIDEVTWNLRELAGARGGIYDGWGTSVMREEEEQ